MKTSVDTVKNDRSAQAAPAFGNPYAPPLDGYDPEVPALLQRKIDDKALLSDDQVRELRHFNTRQLLKSNFWYEFASIARWCTTGLIAATIITTFNTAGFATITAMKGATFGAIASGIAGALVSTPVLALAGIMAVAATVTILASQHSRRVFADKSFDVQDTQMKRQAALIGKAVEKSVDGRTQAAQFPSSFMSRQEPDAANTGGWVERLGVAASQGSHAARHAEASGVASVAKR